MQHVVKMMRLLDRYLLRELLLPFGYCLGGFLIFWISFDLISELEDYQRHQLWFSDILEYYLLRLPELLVVVLPIAFLLALLYALTNHARHHELVAMRAAGVSFWRLGLPYLAVGFFFSVFLFYLNEQWVPDHTTAAQQLLNRRQPSAAEDGQQWQRPLNFRNDAEDRVWTIAAYNLKTHEMIRPQVEWRTADGTQRSMLIAERAQREGGHWTFYNVEQLIYPAHPGSVPFPLATNRLVMSEFNETPELIRSEIKVAGLSSVKAAKKPQLSITEIQNYLRLHRHLAPEKAALLHTQLHGRLAEPWTCLVVVLIALPLGAAPGRRNVFVGVAASIFICFTYFVLLKFGLALGTGGYLPAWLAAWLPNLAFAVLGLGLSYRMQ